MISILNSIPFFFFKLFDLLFKFCTDNDVLFLVDFTQLKTSQV
jgi:hypothetical protein